MSYSLWPLRFISNLFLIYITIVIPVQAQEKIYFGTNWLPQAEHGGFYQAIVDGSYEACGISVKIIPGGPQVNNRALLLAGKIDFYMGGNMLQPFSAAEQNIPLVVVAAFFQKEPQILMSHPNQGLDDWESLKKAQIFISETGFNTYYQWMIHEFGFKASQRQAYIFSSAPFLADKKSVQQGYITSEPLTIEQIGGFRPNIFLLADYGFDSYSTTIETLQSTIHEKSEIVQCFVEASILGWTHYLYGDPTHANELIKQDNLDITDEQLAYSREKMKEYGIIDSGDTLKLGIGAMTHERHKSFYEKMVAAGVASAGIDVRKIYTLDFVNQGIGLALKQKLLSQ